MDNLQIKFYYQIEYIDESNRASMFDSLHDKEEAIKIVNLLEDARLHTKTKGHFTLDLYAFIPDVDDTDVLICKDIQTIDREKLAV